MRTLRKRSRLVAEFDVVQQSTKVHRRVLGPALWRLEVRLRGWGAEDVGPDGKLLPSIDGSRPLYPNRTSEVVLLPDGKLRLSELAEMVTGELLTECLDGIALVTSGSIRAFRRFQ